MNHRWTHGGGDCNSNPPLQIFEKLVNKNAIKPLIGHPLAILS